VFIPGLWETRPDYLPGDLPGPEKSRLRICGSPDPDQEGVISMAFLIWIFFAIGICIMIAAEDEKQRVVGLLMSVIPLSMFILYSIFVTGA
jgi:hypothetical protein